MSVAIRLARGGRKKLPFYAIVVANSRAARDGRFIEKVGTYSPMLPREDEKRVTLNEERIKYWLSVGAQPTERVQSMLAKAGLVKAAQKFEQTKQQMPKAKAQMRVKEAEAAAEAAREAEEAAKQKAIDDAAAAKAAAEAEAEAAKLAAAAPAPEVTEEVAPAETAETESAPAEATPDEVPAAEETAA